MLYYKFDSQTINWMESYLRGRSQYTMIGGKTSSIFPVDRGVPQGSVLGPILYTIYVNEMPDVINQHDTCQNQVHLDGRRLFGKNCVDCGSLPSYADDVTLVMTGDNSMENQLKVARRLEDLSVFLNDNKLAINQEKTVLMEIMT